jgi:osmotically-inducible protein OsmY
MKKHTMILVLALAAAFAYASAQAQQPMGQGQAGGQPAAQPGMQNPNSPANRPNVDMGPDQQSQQQQASENTAKVSDSDLQNAVKSKLASDPAFANVQAAVDKGKVTLDGSVNSKEDKKKAKDAVKSIAGVRGVKEHLTVAGTKDNTSKSSSASGPGGMAFLSSQDAAQGNASQNTSGSIAGNSQTSANPTSSAPQASTPEAGTMSQSGATPAIAGDTSTLQKQIESQIKNDPSLTDSTVSVTVSENSIDLNGTVGSSKAKTNAERIAQSYAQNKKVNDNLQVTGAGNSDLNNGHSAMSNGTPTTPSSTPSSSTMPKGDSSQMPQSNPQQQGDRTSPQ